MIARQSENPRQWAGSAAARLLTALARVLGAVAAGTLAVLVLLVATNVVSRHSFNRSFASVEELAQWLYAGVIFLGLPLGITGRVQMRLDLFADRLHPALSHLAEAITAFAIAGVALGGLGAMRAIGGESPVLGMPEWVRFAVVTVAALLGLAALSLRALAEERSVAARLTAILVGATCALALERTGTAIDAGLPASAVAALAFALALVLGVPVAFALLFGVLAAGSFGSLLPVAAAVQTTVSGSTRFLLLAIPFFLLAGLLMQSGGLATRLIDLAQALVGRWRGALAQTTLATNLMVSGLSGSSIADAALGAKLLVPSLVRHGYPPPYACAVAAATAVLPNIVPPSIAFLILAAAASLSVGDLWLGGLSAGIVVATALAVAIALIGGGGRMRRPPARELLRLLGRAAPVLSLALIVVGTIRLGVVTPTEAGVVAVLYALGLGLFVYRAYDLRSLGSILVGAAVETSSIGLLIGAGAPFAFLLAVDQAPAALSAWMLGLADSPWTVMLLANALLLLVGCVLDIGAAIVIFGPLLLPVAASIGIDPIHFGVVLVVNLMIGGLTPPVGILVYVTSALSGVPAAAVFRAAAPLVLALLAALAFIAAIPEIPLALVSRG